MTYLTITPTLAGAIKAIKTHGLNPYTMLAEYGINPKEAKTFNRNFPLVRLIQLINKTCDELGSYDLISTFVNQYEWDKFDAKIYSLVQQDNLFTLTVVFNALLKEQGSGPQLSLSKQGHVAAFVITLPILKEVNNITYRLVVLSMWDAILSKVLGEDWKPKKIHVSGAGNKLFPQKHVINSIPVNFHKNHNRIEFDSSILFYKPSMKIGKNKNIQKNYNEILSNIPADILTREVLKMVLSSGDASISHIASILGTKPRVLQQKLYEHNNSFSEILQDTRICLGKELLHNTSFKVSEIASQLAFNSSEAFVRFFKKHTNATPLYWRKHT